VRGVASDPGWLYQLTVGRPTTSFQVAKREVISRRYSSALSRWRRGRKCGDISLNADRNRCACPGEVNFFIARSRCRVGWWESGRCGALLRRTLWVPNRSSSSCDLVVFVYQPTEPIMTSEAKLW
jgi:hypothetical protein